MTIDPNTVKKIATAISRGIAMLGDAIKKLRRNSITYRELLHEMMTSKPNDPQITQCAVMKDILPDGIIRLTIIYMNSENTPVFSSESGKEIYGCEITVSTIDQELVDAFNGKPLLIFR